MTNPSIRSMAADTALTTAERAFKLLTCEPAPLAFDARLVPGLPDASILLDELRTLLIYERHDSDTTDALWRQLARHAREWGPAWVVGAIGIALPALTHLAAKISRGNPRHADDVDSEVLAGFLQALRTANLAEPRLWLRLCWTAWRAGVAVIKADGGEELPLDLPSGSRTPRMPYGHPDLLLGRAAAAGLISDRDAELISATRFGDAMIEHLAAAQSVTPAALRMRRRRAERLVATAITSGDLSSPCRSPGFSPSAGSPRPPASRTARTGTPRSGPGSASW